MLTLVGRQVECLWDEVLPVEVSQHLTERKIRPHVHIPVRPEEQDWSMS